MHLTHERVPADRSSGSDTLVVRWERRPTVSIIWLTGALDRTTAPGLERELDPRAIDTIRLVVDLTGLATIDSYGLDVLVRMHRRAPERSERLSFRHGQDAAQRPRGLVRAAQLRAGWAPRSEAQRDDDSYFALAMACVDVDHPRPGDRPKAA
jgi:anti-anti-sigma factor